MAKRRHDATLADRLFPSAEEEELEESILNIPPEQRRLHTETFDFSIATLVDQLRSGAIYVPEFQRGQVWSDAQQSRLIESLIIQCPIPVLYLSQGRDQRLAVVDGNQRLTAIRRFLDNELALTGLTAYPELGGQTFTTLDVRFQRHILNRTLRCIVITRETHPQVKFDVFERLNSGAVKLTAQELRHGIYHGPLMEMLDDLARHPQWRRLVPKTFARRMKSEELILRFLAIHHDLGTYEKPLAGFLNKFAEKHRQLDDDTEGRFHSAFTATIDGVMAVYGDLAFRMFDADHRPVSSFNAALFDAEMLSISHRPGPTVLGPEQRQAFLADLASLFADEDFLKTITRATSDEPQLKKRVKMVAELLNRHA